MKLFKLFFLFMLLAGFTGCMNESDELVDDGGILSRSVSTTYYLDGADKLYTGSPEKFTVKAKDGSALPAGLKAIWNYPSDLYRVTYDETSITFGRKLAVGTYEIIGTLNNGQTVSKFITAIDSNKPEAPLPTENTVTLYLNLISDGTKGFTNIDLYKLGNKNYFYSTGDIYINFTINNKLSVAQTLDATHFRVAYGYQVQPYTLMVYAEGTSSNPLSTINLPAGRSETYKFKLPENWNSNLKTSVDGFTYLQLYFMYDDQRFGDYSYCVSLKK